MAIAEIEAKERFRIGFRRDVATEHFPINVAEGLDALLRPGGYKRVPQTDPQAEEFIWENNRRDRLTVYYYTKVNEIGRSAVFDEDKDLTTEDVEEGLNTLYGNLDATIGTLSQHLGFPYISSTKELMLEIEGSNPTEKAKTIIPIVQELYKKTEGIQVFSVDILDQTVSSIQICFGHLE